MTSILGYFAHIILIVQILTYYNYNHQLGDYLCMWPFLWNGKMLAMEVITSLNTKLALVCITYLSDSDTIKNGNTGPIATDTDMRIGVALTSGISKVCYQDYIFCSQCATYN